MYYNIQIENLFGYKQEELIGKSFINFIPKQEIPKYLSKLKEIFIKKEIFPFETLSLHKNGNLIPVEISGKVIKYNGKTVGIGTIRDITDRKKAEKALKESEEKYRLITENTSDTIWIYNIKQNKYTYVSPSISQLSGFSPEERLQHSLNASLSTDSTKKAKEIIRIEYQKFLKNSDTNNFQINNFQIKHKDGSLIWIEVSSRFRYNSNEEVEIVGISRNIEERIKAEKALKESEERLKTLVNSVPDIICFKDGEGHWLIANEADLKLFQLEGVDYVGKKDSELATYSPFYYDAFMACEDTDKIAWQDGKESRAIEKIPNIEGGHYFYDIIKVPIFNPDNTRNALVVFGRDITKIKKTEQDLKDSETKLKESNATKDKFFSIIAHDLKSPFNAMLGFSNMLVKNHTKYDAEKRDKMINLVNDSAINAFKLLENLLTWSRSQSGTISFSPEKLYLKILLSEIIFDLQGQAKKKEIKVLDAIAENCEIFADKNMLATVLRNLISNAIKFTNKNGEIKISAKQNDKNIIISVADNGVGINKVKLKKIFDLSKKTSTQGTENETGTGLGLALCREFAEKQGGKIWVESEEGQGSTFYFTIPNKQAI